MRTAAYSFRLNLLRASACATLALGLPLAAHGAQPASEVDLGLGAGVGLAAAMPQSETIVVKAQRRLLREKNSPSAVTELGQKQIDALGVGGSVATLLRQAPSVNVYQQSLGDSAPELTIRGLRGLETAQTLDGVPTQDLLAPGSFYLANNIGSFFTLDQIDGVSIYPGVAYPDKNTFGTIGGTIAYSTKRPSNDYYLDVTGSVGSFGTYKEGFTLNSGALDSVLGTGDNAAKMLLQYNNFQTGGYIDFTGSRENAMEFALDKPYNDGLSKFQATVLYNTGSGLIQNEPVPLPYLQKNGMFSNYQPNQEFARENNDFLSIILKDDHYVNDYLSLGVTAFYLGNDNSLETFGNINLFPPAGQPGPATVGAASPFVNNPAGFGDGGLYGPGGPFFDPVAYPYNPLAAFPIGSKECPASLANKFPAGAAPCGLNAEITEAHSDTYGIQPRATIVLPEFFGIANTIKIGGLFAKETSPAQQEFLGGDAVIQETPQNLVSGFDGGTQRTIYQGYIQDKIDLLDNTLHVTPGLTLEGTDSSLVGSKIMGGFNPTGSSDFGSFKATKWDRVYLPFFNVSYDFDKIFPALKGLQAYGSTGQSALFAPVTDFSPNLVGGAPNASIVHLYEGGLKYNTSRLSLQADYYYQKVDRDFGFFTFQSGPQIGDSLFTNSGQREFKGVEASGTWQVTPAIQLFGNFSYTRARYLSTSLGFATVAEDQFGINQKGTPVAGVPDWLSTYGVNYAGNSLLRDGDAINVRFTGQYTGEQATTFDLNGFDKVAKIPGIPQDPFTIYEVTAGATTFDPHGGISPYSIFNLDVNYTLPTPELRLLKNLKFDLNVQNLFDQSYFQYFYKQISPAACGNFTSGPFGPSPAHPNGLPKGPEGCTPEFADGIPGQPFSVFFTVTARF
jgi:iron complex outermembrane recepter protein